MELFAEQLQREHLFSKIDARLKLVVAIAVLMMVISCSGFIFPLLVMCLSFAIYMKLRMPPRFFIVRFSEPVLIAAVLVVIKTFFSGHETLSSFNCGGLSITVYRDGLIDGLLIASRIAGAVSVIALFSLTATYTEIMASLSWLRIPRTFVEILTLAFRYIFVLREEAMVIYNAQKNRLGYSSLRRGLSSFGILAGSLTLRAFDHSQNVTISMVQRGYDGSMPVFRHKPFKPAEIVASLLVIVAMGCLWTI